MGRFRPRTPRSRREEDSSSVCTVAPLAESVSAEAAARCDEVAPLEASCPEASHSAGTVAPLAESVSAEVAARCDEVAPLEASHPEASAPLASRKAV